MYRKINAYIRKAIQEAKDNWIQIQCKSIDNDMRLEDIIRELIK